MASPIVRLSTAELWSALDRLDPVAVVVDELMGSGVDNLDRAGQGAIRLMPPRWDETHTRHQAGGTACLEDLRTGARLVLPAADLRAIRVAALGALAARRLLTPGIVIAAVLGSDTEAGLHISLMTQHIPGVSHIAIWRADGRPSFPVIRKLSGQLDAKGIGISVSGELEEVVRGADLVVLIGAEMGNLCFGHLATGALVVNGLGRKLPGEIVTGVNQVYVDYVQLVHGQFRVTPAEPRDGVAPARRQPESGRPRRIEADLFQIITGAHPGRTSVDDILLVELLSANMLSANLAWRLQQANS